MLQEGQQLRHYRIAGLLKSGGMGEVYLAIDTLLHRQVAIKVIQSDAISSKGLIERLAANAYWARTAAAGSG